MSEENKHRCDIEAFSTAAMDIRGMLLQTAQTYLHDSDAAEDAVQDTLMRCWIARSRIQSMKELPPLSRHILHNLCIDRLRTRHWHMPLEDYDVHDSAPKPDECLDMQEQQKHMMQCIYRLPPSMRAVIEMKAIDGLTYQEIATILGTTESAVRSRMAKARKRLFELYNL